MTSADLTSPTGTSAPEGPPASLGANQARRRRRAAFASIVLPSVVVATVLAAWEAASAAGLVSEIILPAPSAIAIALFDIMQEAYFWEATSVTVLETVYGFLIGCGIAWLLGMAMSLSVTIRRMLYPIVVAFQNTPRVALAPLFLVWFGFGMMSKVIMAATICFFPLLISIVVGMETVDRDARLLMRSMGATRWQLYRTLSLPASLPYFFAGLKTAMTLALTGAIVAEFVGANDGMGVLIKTYNFQLNVAEGFATIFVLMVIGLLLYGLMEWIDRRIVFWRDQEL
ncbi:ABC transporter permease [Agromyces sp. SYSU T00194]|uniref:ABC transporter permease n=1 Tax=Agromyces chitinivorans TaxID=3158560 RepID=UPI0033996380